MLFFLFSLIITAGCSTGNNDGNSDNENEAYSISFTDDSGQEIKMKEPAKRIISLYSAHTENLFALGMDEEIIGVGTSDIYPPKVSEKDVFDYKSDPEKVIAANPDLVLIRPFIETHSPDFVTALKNAGVNVVSLYPESFDEFDRYISTLALVTGTEEKAQEMLDDFHIGIAEIEKETSKIEPKVNVYFESTEQDYRTVTPDSMPARALKTAGGINIAENVVPISEGSSIAPFGVEKILENADIIDVYISQVGAMNAGGSFHSITIRPGFAAIKAVEEGRIFVINEKIISSPTFRYLKGIEEISRALYPEVFDDISVLGSEQPISRKNMAELVVKYKHSPIFVPTSSYFNTERSGHSYGSFSDVDIDNPLFDYIETAVASGYMEGRISSEKETFCPDETVTREEFAEILFMLADLKDNQEKVSINDISEVKNQRMVELVVQNGLMEASNGLFRPDSQVTGKEAVEALEKLSKLDS